MKNNPKAKNKVSADRVVKCYQFGTICVYTIIEHLTNKDMKDYIKKMRECNQKVADTMREFVNALIEMVRAHDGFILTNGEDKDNVCGYALDWEGELNEYNLLALRLIREDGCNEDSLQCFLAPKFGGTKVTYTKEDMFSEFCTDQWYNLEGYDDMLYTWATLVDMMGIIDEFDQFGTICVYIIIEHLTNKKMKDILQKRYLRKLYL